MGSIRSEDDQDSNQRRVAGVVVLYHPDASVLENVMSYLSDLEVLYAIDNTPAQDSVAMKGLLAHPGVVYVPLGDNTGVAHALNVGARMARDDGYQYLLMMDQDSRAFSGMVPALMSVMGSEPQAAIVASSQPGDDLGEGWCDVMNPITSGSLLRLRVWADIGPFFEELFIDLVDVEYALRARCAGYGVLRARGALLLHQLGDARIHRWFWIGRVGSSNHSSSRRYYITRNTLLVGELYGAQFPGWWALEQRLRRNELGLIALFEAERLQKFRLALLGRRHYRERLLGRHPDRIEDATEMIAELRDTKRLRPYE